MTDPLTGLLNRAGFGEAAERLLALAGREQLPVSVALIDLDGFKQVNDRKGHAAGDELLVELGRAWRAGAARLRGAGAPGRRRVRARSSPPPVDAAASTRWPAARRLAGRLERRRGRVATRRGARRAMARADEELYRAKREARAAPLGECGATACCHHCAALG